MLYVQAVLPRIKAARVRVVEIYARAQIRERAERRSGRPQYPATEGIGQSIERREEIVLSSDQRCRTAESVLTAAVEAGLGKSSKAAADHLARAETISESSAWLPFVIVSVGVAARLPVHAGEKDCARYTEGRRGQKLLQRLHAGITRVCRIR